MIYRTVAALYVQERGCYYGQPGVEPWGLPERDARTYAGPHPVVAHPPCARWGRYWFGGPRPTQPRRLLGDDEGCFAAALASVRLWGGVLEHPADSHAWRVHGLLAPPRRGGWIPAGDSIGWTCCVEQGHYGHAARKGTWLYAVGTARPGLAWGESAATGRIDMGFRTTEERRRWVRREVVQQLSKRKRAATPPEFRELLLALARSVPPPIPRGMQV